MVPGGLNLELLHAKYMCSGPLRHLPSANTTTTLVFLALLDTEPTFYFSKAIEQHPKEF